MRGADAEGVCRGIGGVIMTESNIAESYQKNPAKYQKSIANELSVIKDRVRFLIGDKHWASDGTYKETILRNVIKRFLPPNLGVGYGFILRYEAETVYPSTQIDIIVYDTSYPLVFQQDDFIITTSSAVKGIIEVKTKITSNNFGEVIKKCTELDRYLNIRVFNGIFAFEGSLDFDNEMILNHLRANKGQVNHICVGENKFIRFWPPGDDFLSEYVQEKHYTIYDIEKFAFSYFISNLVVMSTPHDLHEQAGFLFAVPGGKDLHRIKDVKVD